MYKPGPNEMLAPQQNNPFQIESRDGYVLYDSDSGRIVHVHIITRFRGGEGLPSDEHEARALEMAKRMGHNVERLRVLRVEPDQLKPGRQQVDLKNRALVEKPTSLASS